MPADVLAYGMRAGLQAARQNTLPRLTCGWQTTLRIPEAKHSATTAAVRCSGKFDRRQLLRGALAAVRVRCDSARRFA